MALQSHVTFYPSVSQPETNPIGYLGKSTPIGHIRTRTFREGAKVRQKQASREGRIVQGFWCRALALCPSRHLRAPRHRASSEKDPLMMQTAVNPHT